MNLNKIKNILSLVELRQQIYLSIDLVTHVKYYKIFWLLRHETLQYKP